MVTKTVSATEARIHFGELMRRVVEDQQPVTIERAGKPQVVVVSIEQYEQLVTGHPQEPDWRKSLQHAHVQITRELSDIEIAPTDEIIRQMREERSEQLLDALR